MQRIATWRKHFNWRMLVMRTVVNALALLITVILVPRIYFVDSRLSTWLLITVILGILNAFIKPIIQFAMLPFIFATYGVIVALINAIILLLLALILPDRFAVDSLLWALVGGAVIGIVSALLENMLGLTPPIVSEKYPQVRELIKQHETRSVEDYVAKVEAKQIGQTEEAEEQAAPSKTAADAAAILAVVGTEQAPGEAAAETPEADEPEDQSLATNEGHQAENTMQVLEDVESKLDIQATGEAAPAVSDEAHTNEREA